MKFLLLSLVTWKIWLVVFLLLGVVFIPLRLDFLGGGVDHYSRYPWFWAWSNFDGEHYLAIAQHGYGEGEQAFFPLYSILMKFLVWPVRGDLYFLQIAGLVISYVSFFVGLLGLWKLIKLDFKQNIVHIAIFLLLVFPTSFYFGGVYTESLFFSLAVWSFYSARRERWLLAAVLGGFATATKFLGIILLPALFAEWMWGKGKRKRSNLLVLSLIPIGLTFYMYYLYKTVGDPFYFFHSLTLFGEQRSIHPIILPQVFWRYAKILIDIPKNDPLFLTVVIELTTAVIFLIASIVSFFKLRISYAIYLTLGYVIPTLSGSFSSLPRYCLILFPAFILFSIYLSKQSLIIQLTTIIFCFILLAVLTSMFARGYWIS